jgi:hypothetical protein
MKSQFNYKINAGKLKFKSRVSAESGDEKTSTWVSHHNATFRYFHMVSTFDFRFQKDKCAIWLGFVFLRSTSLILDDMRLKIQTRPKFVWVNLWNVLFRYFITLYSISHYLEYNLWYLFFSRLFSFVLFWFHLLRLSSWYLFFSWLFSFVLFWFHLFRLSSSSGCFLVNFTFCRRQAVVFWLILNKIFIHLF